MGYKEQMSQDRRAGIFPSMTEAPSAATYGVGPAWIGGKIYWSDSARWNSVGGAMASHISSITFSGSVISVDCQGFSPPYSIAVYPGSGNTYKAETCLVPDAATTDPGASYWEEWTEGTTGVSKSYTITSPISAVRFTRVSGSSENSAEVWGML